MATVWAATFTWLSVARHLAGGSNAEDMGFTDQVIWNFLQLQLQGHWFRTSIYNGASWNTELDISRIARPDSLLAFHFEPMLLLFVPVYALGGGAVALLVIQALAFAAGALPAYRLGRHAGGSTPSGLAVAAAYLLSPLGQWAVLADFHTSTLAAPLLMLTVERLVVGRAPRQAILVAALAAAAREDVGIVVAILGLTLLMRQRSRWTAISLLVLGATSTVLATSIIHIYSGGSSLFDVRYGPTLGGGIGPVLSAIARPAVAQYATMLLLSGGWLGLLSPLALLPALPSLALNVLSMSPWMAAGKAHYSALVLPFLIIGAAAGLRRLREHHRAQPLACAALVLTGVMGYVVGGAGPFGGDYAPAAFTAHTAEAAAIADRLPPDAGVSATSSLVPRVSHRSRVYVFPAVLDADYVFLDLQASPAPTSAGDVYLRVHDMLAGGDWQLESADDGLLLLRRTSETVAAQIDVSVDPPIEQIGSPNLRSAELVPSPDGAIDIDGPRWILRTTWQTDAPLATGTHLDVVVDLDSGEQLHRWDVADLWWNPPERWVPGQSVTVSVRDIPIRRFKSWSATWTRT
jgi:uncharacterized membrane protein